MDSLLDLQHILAALQGLPSVAWRFMTPPPISPHFKAGGVLEGYNEDLCQFLGAVLLFTVLDFAIVKRFVLSKARYFALHTICNAVVCCLSLSAVIRVFTEDPLKVFGGPSDSTACNNVIAALHFYHCVAFKLSADDIFHHFTFCFTLCAMAIPAKQLTGASVPFGAFFLSGLPGGIDYFMLTLTAHGYVSKDFQKDLSQKINLWMRAPSMTLYAFLCFNGSCHGVLAAPWYIILIPAYLHYSNGQYYGQQAIESNAIYKYKKQLEAKGITVPDIKFSDLHKDTDDTLPLSSRRPAPMVAPHPSTPRPATPSTSYVPEMATAMMSSITAVPTLLLSPTLRPDAEPADGADDDAFKLPSASITSVMNTSNTNNLLATSTSHPSLVLRPSSATPVHPSLRNRKGA